MFCIYKSIKSNFHAFGEIIEAYFILRTLTNSVKGDFTNTLFSDMSISKFQCANKSFGNIETQILNQQVWGRPYILNKLLGDILISHGPLFE